jgi:hypothetical protein
MVATAATARTTALRTTGRHTTAPRMRGLLRVWAACTRTAMVAATDTRRRSTGATAAAARAAAPLAVILTESESMTIGQVLRLQLFGMIVRLGWCKRVPAKHKDVRSSYLDES